MRHILFYTINKYTFINLKTLLKFQPFHAKTEITKLLPILN